MLRERQDFGQYKFHASRSSPSSSKSQNKNRHRRKPSDTKPSLPIVPTNDDRLQRPTGDKFDVDAYHGWVSFGDEFIGPHVRSSYEQRSGRGLSEGDNDSLHQPIGSPSADAEVNLRERRDFGQNSQHEPIQAGASKRPNRQKERNRQSKMPPQPVELGRQAAEKDYEMDLAESEGRNFDQKRSKPHQGDPSQKSDQKKAQHRQSKAPSQPFEVGSSLEIKKTVWFPLNQGIGHLSRTVRSKILEDV